MKSAPQQPEPNSSPEHDSNATETAPSLSANRVHAFSDDALGYGDATAISERIRRGEISATEAVEAAINRVQKIDPQLHAIAWEDYDRARQRAQVADSGGKATAYARGRSEYRGDFAGVPMVFKDNVAVSGLPMTHGSKALSKVPQTQNDAITRQILGLGVIPVGTSTMPPFAWTGVTEQQEGKFTANPWNTAHNSGGSSGGTAALVAAGAVPIGHASDGGGSIRIPAHACGLIGLKPTRGRLRGTAAGNSVPLRIASHGVLARSVRDIANSYSSLEYLWRNPRLQPVGLVTRPIRRRLTIGVVRTSPIGAPADNEVQAALDRAISLLTELGHRVQPYELKVPSSLVDDFRDYSALLALGAVSKAIKPQQMQHLDNLTAGLARRGKSRLSRLPFYMSRLYAHNPRFRSLMRGGPDLLLSPVVNHSTPKNGEISVDLPYEEHMSRLLRWICISPYANVTGAPAISLPMDTDSLGLPMGMMFSGPHNSERTLLGLAFEIEQAQPWAHIWE